MFYQVGAATAVELTRQKEQLLNTESKLDEINSSLRQSERHIQGIRSVFGSIRNYFSGHSNSAQAPAPAPAPAPAGPGNRNLSSSASTGSSFNNLNNRVTQSHSAVDQISTQNYNAVDERLDRNLDDMASSLARLKGLAQGLNTELDDHDQIIGRVHDKAEVVGFKVEKQNRDMGRILKK